MNDLLKKNKISIFAVIGTMYSLTAAGAFGLESMIPACGPGLALTLLLVIPVVWAIPQALVAMELGSALPVEGGAYKWIQHGCGEFWGFQAGLWRSVCGVISVPVFVVMAGNYVASTIGLDNLERYIFEIVLILIVTFINLRGIREAYSFSTILSLLILVAFVLVTVIGFMHWTSNPFRPFVPEGQGIGQGLGIGLAIGLWMYMGYDSMASVAGELEEPQIIPKALILTMPLIILTYLLPTISCLGSYGHWSEWGSDGVSYGTVAAAYLGPVMGIVFMSVAFLAQITMFNACTATMSRIFFTIAEDNLFPKSLAKIDKKYGVPRNAILLMAAVDILLCQLEFSTIVLITVVLALFSIGLELISAVILRYRYPQIKGPFRVPLGNFAFSVMCMIPIMIAFIVLYLSGIDCFILGLLMVALSPIVYFIFKRLYGGLSKIDPENYPLNLRTKMTFGDTKRMAVLFTFVAILGLIALYFFPWHEDAQYYASVYGKEGIFETFMAIIRYVTVGSVAIAVILLLVYKKCDAK